MPFKPETIQQHRARQAKYLQNVHRLLVPQHKLEGYCDCSNCELQRQEPKHHFAAYAMLIMVVALLAVFVRGCVDTTAHAAEYTDTQIVNAIKHAENSKKFPYGIRSIKCNTEQECRQICLNSVRNARKRWVKAGRPEDFIVFMGRRYSPPNINPNWVRLVKFFLQKQLT